jgi:GTP-binding protein Era
VKSAAVAVVGRPSSGKSTLLNRLCGGKVSIVSPVPQTTRNRVRGILTEERGQLVLIDTPGFHLSEKKLNRLLVDLVSAALSEVDMSLYIVDGTRSFGEEEAALLEILRARGKPCVIALNKSDAASPHRGGLRDTLEAALPGRPLHEVSALTGDGVARLTDSLFAMAPEGDQLYPADYYTDQPPEFRISEIVREKAINQTRQEVPHSLYVRIEDLEMRDGGAYLWARGFVCVERVSQRGILVGKGGERIKQIVREAEAELCGLFPYPVRLDMRVKVDKDWRSRSAVLKSLIR